MEDTREVREFDSNIQEYVLVTYDAQGNETGHRHPAGGSLHGSPEESVEDHMREHAAGRAGQPRQDDRPTGLAREDAYRRRERLNRQRRAQDPGGLIQANVDRYNSNQSYPYGS